MKKLIALALILVSLIPAAAFADVDLSGMSFDELVSLNGKLLEEIMSRDEFKEVTVPTGAYTVGEDIPAGTYSLAMATGTYGGMIQINGYQDAYTVTSTDPIVGKVTLKDGDSVEISMGSIVFKPYVGLGF